MADVSKIKLPNNSEYDIKDASAIHSVKTINNQSIVGTGNIDIGSSSKNIWYGTCASYASAENKVVTTSSQDFDFQTGSMLRVSFEDGNTISSPYLVVDSGEPVLIEKLGLHQEVIAIISRTVTSSYWQYFDFDFPALSPGSSLSVTINLNSPYDSQDTYTDTASFIAGQRGNEQMFVYQGSFLDVQYNGINTISISSSYSWSVAFSGDIKSGIGESESLVDYWKPGAVLDFVFDGTNFVLSDGGTNIPKNMWYGTCATSGSTTAKIVNTSTGDFSLKTGNMVRVLFNNATTSTLTSLAVDGTAAIYVASAAGSADSSYRWNSGEVVDFVYDGTNYVMSDGGIASTTYYGATKLSSSTSSTSTSLAATPSAVKSAYDLANSKVSDVQVDGTSVVSSRTASISTSSSPAANTIAKFDSSAHMNSADMTAQEIDDFVDSVPSAFDNLKNLNVLHDITAGGNVEAAGDVTADGNSILDALYFKPGDTYVAVGRHTGLCTNASKDMQLSLVLPKSAKYCAGFTITNITGGVRISTGGYADNVGDGTSWSGRSGISFGGGLYNADGTNHASGDGKDAYMCTANIIKTSAFKQNGTTTNVVNNTPVTLGGNITIEFT